MQFLFFIWMFFQWFLLPNPRANIFELTNEQQYKIDVNTTVSYRGIGTATTDLFLGILQSNEYQELISSEFQFESRTQGFGFDGDSCVYYHIELGNRTRKWHRKLVQQSYTIKVHDVHVDFDKIDTIYPYDTSSFLYKNYTASNPPFIETDNVYLQNISDSIWKQSQNVLEYARNCYQYVPKKFQYLNPISGFHTLDNILAKGGGDCGNLSSVYVTLLRMQGIPARHLVGFRSDNTLHVWSDFYLEGYGWIPLDVTYEQSDPEGDYFGHITFKQNGFIIHRGIGHTVSYRNGFIRVPSLQTYAYQDSYSMKTNRKIIIDREVVFEHLTGLENGRE